MLAKISVLIIGAFLIVQLSGGITKVNAQLIDCKQCGNNNGFCCVGAYNSCQATEVLLGNGGCRSGGYSCVGGICIQPTPTIPGPTPIAPTSPIATIAPPDPNKCKLEIGGGGCPSGFSIACGGSRPGYCCKTDVDCQPYPTTPPGFTGTPNCDANGDAGVLTGLGCLSVEGKNTIQTLLNWGIVVGSGIAFVMILLAALQINTARGDAKRVAAAKELLISALSGLALIALCVVLLNFAGVNLLGLNTIGFNP